MGVGHLYSMPGNFTRRGLRFFFLLSESLTVGHRKCQNVEKHFPPIIAARYCIVSEEDVCHSKASKVYLTGRTKTVTAMCSQYVESDDITGLGLEAITILSSHVGSHRNK